MSILQTTELKKYYGAKPNITRALDGVTLSIEKGEFVAIVGTSGSGKSTLLNMIGGLDVPTSGKVIVDGRELSTLKDEQLTIFRRRKIGFIFQNYNLVPVLNVYENIVLPVELDGNKVDKKFMKEVVQMLGLEDLCIVLFNSIIIVTQSMDEEKWITRTTKTDFTVYNSIAVNVQEGFRHHEDALPQQVVDMIREQNGLEEERYLYRNTVDDGNVLVDYGFEGLTCTNTFEYENGISKSFGNYALNTAPDAENLFFGNVYGASEHFWSDMMIYDGETDPNVLKQKMLTGEYVIIGNRLDRLSGGPKTTSLSEQLQIGDSISFYRDGELVKTCTILAKACTVGTEDETPTTTTATMHIGGDAPFVYLPDTVFKQIYTTPTLLNYGFNMDASLHPQMEDFLSSYVEKNPSVTYTSTKLLKEQLNSVASMVWVVGSLIGCIMALAGLINFTNMIITNIITRRHEFATMQSIGMTNRQLQRLMVYEGVYYAAGADIIGGVVALLLAVTVLKNVLNSPSMWFFTLHITLVPALVIGVLYLLLAAVIPLIVLHFFNKGTVVERLRTSE